MWERDVPEGGHALGIAGVGTRDRPHRLDGLPQALSLGFTSVGRIGIAHDDRVPDHPLEQGDNQRELLVVAALLTRLAPVDLSVTLVSRAELW